MPRHNQSGSPKIRQYYLAPNAVRITHAIAGDTDFPPDRPWLQDVLLPQPEVSLEDKKILIDTQGGCLRARTLEGKEFFREVTPARLGIRRRIPFLSLGVTELELRAGVRRVDEGVRLKLAVEPGESFYGWGEWFNAFCRRRGKINLYVSNALAMFQSRATYSAIPVFFSSRGYGFFLLNSHMSRWRIDPEKGTMQIEADGPGADYILIYGPTFREIITTYTAMTGRPALPPRWAFGLWTTCYPQVNQEETLAHVRAHRQRNIPLDAVILDYHWEERFHNFQWRPSLFPSPPAFVESLHTLQVRLGLILTSFLNRRNRPLQKFLFNTVAQAHNLPPGLEQDDERALPEFQEAQANHYLAHTGVRWWFGEGGLLDFTNPAAAAWWNRKIRSLYAQGVDFIKNDDGEDLPEDAHSANGMDGVEYHNLYGFYYGKATYDSKPSPITTSTQTAPPRSLVYARSVWAGSQRYPAMFLGDQKPTFEGMRSTLRAGLNLSLLGFSYWGADVFGLDGETTPETHMRYAQWGLLNPVARYFWRPASIDDTRLPWSHGPQVEANFRTYLELRYQLLPYYYTLAWQAYQTGLPILRPLLLEFPEEANRLAEVYDQVMLGDRLMLCPIVTGGTVSRQVLLPEGTWHDYWTEQSWRGPAEIEYPAALDRLPILVRGGALLPLGPILQHIPDDHRFDDLKLHLWPPYPVEFSLYEDDGCTTAYQHGDFTLTHFRAEGDDRRLIIRILPGEGGFSTQPETRQIEIILHCSPEPNAVWINGILQVSYVGARRKMETTKILNKPAVPLLRYAYDVHAESVIEIEFNPNIAACVV